MKIPSRMWRSTDVTDYQVAGGRDVLIIAAPDPFLHHLEAVARRPGQLTEEDKLMLKRQGVYPYYQELDIVKARYELDKKHNNIEVKSRHLSQKSVIGRICNLLNTTQNDGGT